MALYSLTARQLIEQIGLLGLSDMGMWKAGTATGGSTSSLVDTVNRFEADDFFNTQIPTARIHIYSTTDGQAPQGEERFITDWGQSSLTAVVSPAFSAAVEAGDKYVILSEFSWQELLAAINMAIDEIAGLVLVPVVDETLTLTTGTYELALPSEFQYVSQVTVADSDGSFINPLAPTDWRILQGDPAKLQLMRLLEGSTANIQIASRYSSEPLPNGRAVRIEGMASQARLVDDADVCNLDPNFIVHRAAAWVLSKRARRSDAEPNGYQTLAAYHNAEADKRLGKLSMQLPPGSRRVM